MSITEAIEYVDLDAGMVRLADGTELPITDWFDCDGDDCEPENAVTIVAGSEAFGWIDVELSRAETVH